MTNQNFAEAMIVWCDFDKSETRLSTRIRRRLINSFNEEKDSEIIDRIKQFFDNKKIEELPHEKFKPEIGKKRPVLIIHLHERMKSAIVLPLTTQKPWGEDEEKVMILFPKEKKPSVLGTQDSWILCDMPYHVSIDKLEKAERKKKKIDVSIDREIYREVIRKYKEIIADDIV